MYALISNVSIILFRPSTQFYLFIDVAFVLYWTCLFYRTIMFFLNNHFIIIIIVILFYMIIIISVAVALAATFSLSYSLLTILVGVNSTAFGRKLTPF